MSKVKSWTANKTNIIRLDEKIIVTVDMLSEDIQFDIETYDKIRQEYLDLMYEQDKLHHAINGKLSAIINKIRNYLIEQDKKQKVNEGEQT